MSDEPSWLIEVEFPGTANSYTLMKTGTWDTPDKNDSGERKANELLFLTSVITYFSKSLQKIDHKS